MTDNVTLHGVGAWHLMPKPIAFRSDMVEKTFIGWFYGNRDRYGEVGVSAYDHETRRLESHTLIEYDWVDDHTAPGILELDDGRLLAVWGPRGGDHTSDFHWTRTTNPHDISEWEGIKTYENDVDDYPQLVHWDGNIRVYFRNMAGDKDVWTYVESTDNANSFGPVQDWIDFTGYQDQFEDDDRPEFHRVYPSVYKEERSGNDRLHFAFGGYRHVNQDKIRHAYLEDGEYYDSHANPIGLSDGDAITDMDDMTAFGLDHWTEDHWTDSPKMMDLNIHEGEPHIAFEDIHEVGEDGADGDYSAGWAKYDSDSGQWITSTIKHLGAMLPESTPVPGGYYKGGIRFDSQDPTTVFLSVEKEDRNYQVQEWTTDDDGETWTKVQDLTDDGEVRYFGPHGKRGGITSPANHDGEELRVLWWEGMHNRFNDYDVRIWTEPTVDPIFVADMAVDETGDAILMDGDVIGL